MNKIVLTRDYVKEILPTRPKNSNKGTFGKVLNIAGCENYKGAAWLSSVSALKVGAGLVTLASEEKVVNNLFMPPVTTISLDGNSGTKDFAELTPVIYGYDVISTGSGVREDEYFKDLLFEVLNLCKTVQKPTVIDAGALNIIAREKYPKLFETAIITPHPKEASRLLDENVEDICKNREYSVQKLRDKFGCTAVLKGEKTLIAGLNGVLYENTTGNSALAKAGSGDVLTGMISGFCAQTKNTVKSACLGVFMHGQTGDEACLEMTEYCVNSDDLIKFIPQAFKTIL